MRTKTKFRWLTLLALGTVYFVFPVPAQGEKNDPSIYVPLKELARIVERKEYQQKAVFMDRAEFEKLLNEAEAAVQASDSREIGQITQATLTGRVEEEKLILNGTLKVVTMSDRPVLLPLGFGGMGLREVSLAGKACPLGFDKKGQLVAILTGKGEHSLQVQAESKLKDLPTGGMQFGMSLPAAVEGTMNLSVPGDLEIHATAPVVQTKYDRESDRTNAELTIGGRNQLTVVLLGNGRRDAEESLLLGESITTIELTGSHQILSCLYMAQVLRRGQRQLEFEIPAAWTITEVTCPDLLRWSIEKIPPNGAKSPIQRLQVKLRSGKAGTKTLHIQGTAAREGATWENPRILLSGAGYQRGYLLVSPNEQLHVRGESISQVRREDMQTASSLPGLVADLNGRLYFHWGESWSVKLKLAEVALRRSIEQRQWIEVSEKQVQLRGEFEVTAVDRNMFTMQILLPARNQLWQVEQVLVNGKDTGFEYQVHEQENHQELNIELPQPVKPQQSVKVALTLRNVPSEWQWNHKTSDRDISVPLLIFPAETVTGYVLVSAQGDFDAEPMQAPEGLEIIPLGRMVTLGLSEKVQQAYRHSVPLERSKNILPIRISRRQSRISAASIGLIDVQRHELKGFWRITYNISRAHTRKLYLLADRGLGENLRFESPQVRFVSKNQVVPGESTMSLTERQAEVYTLWELIPDQPVAGPVMVYVQYERSLESGGENEPEQANEAGLSESDTDSAEVKTRVSAPLVRPICQGQIQEQLAVQASEDLALTVETAGMTEKDAIDLPPLPREANRILAAFQLARVYQLDEPEPVLDLHIQTHQNYEIPSALVVSGELRTYLDAQGSQRTQARYRIVNAGMQFLTIRLAEGADLWSLEINDRSAKPQRSEQGDYRLAIGKSHKPFLVKLVYACSTEKKKMNRLELAGVELPGLQMNKVMWEVIPPPGYQVSRQYTAMETRDLIPPTPAYVQIYNYVSENLFCGAGMCCLLPALHKAREQAVGAVTMSTLMQIGDAVQMYQDENNGQWPDSLDRLIEAGLVHSEDYLHDTNNYRFEYFPPKGKLVSPETTILARSSVINNRQYVLFADGHVEAERVGAEGYEYFGRGAAPASKKSRKTDVSVVDEARKPVIVEEFEADRVVVSAYTYHPRVAQEGRYTLPVELEPMAGTGRGVRFTGMEANQLVIGITHQGRISSWWILGFIVVIAVGAGLLRKSVRWKALLFVSVLAASTFLAIWFPATTYFANGCFLGSLALIPLYLVLALIRWLFMPARLTETGKVVNAVPLKPVTILILWFSLTSFSNAAAPKEKSSPAQPALPPVIYSYDGDPSTLAGSDKVLISYPRFVELWNQAHPEERIEAGKTATDFGLADVEYQATVTEEKLELVLRADFATYGKEGAVLPLPITGLAVTQVTLNGQEASLHATGQGMVLMLPGETQGRFELKAEVKPKLFGRRGNVNINLPPLPAAVLQVNLPAEDLELEAVGTDVEPVRQANPRDWSVPLGMSRKLTLRWLPKIGIGLTDRTLSASSEHEVYAFHWALIGVSKIRYQFSGGQHDRFTVLVPQGYTLTDLKGTNLRDYRIAGQTTRENQVFDVVQARLHRTTEKHYELTVRWLVKLPALNQANRFFLVRPGEVARESGTVVLHRSSGMILKVSEVRGGRRQNLPQKRNLSSPGISQPVAKYYWPYRPFSLSIQLSHLSVRPQVHLDQLIRFDTDQVQLLVRAVLATESDHLYGVSFQLPAGFELLSVVGAAVGRYYEQAGDQANALHVQFSSAQKKTELALVLVSNQVPWGEVAVPTVTYLDPSSPRGLTPNSLNEVKVTGRLAVQVAASIDAYTLLEDELKSLQPRSLKDWLDAKQMQAVQFAYHYESLLPRLQLNLQRKSTKIRLETFVGLSIKPTAGVYTYRLRYQITGSPIDHIQFRMDNAYAGLAAVESGAIRCVSKTPDEATGMTTWKVGLLNEVTGTVDLAVNFILPIDATTTELPIPRIETDEIKDYYTIVAIQNLSRHDIQIQQASQFSELPVSEQGKVLPRQMSQSIQYVYQSFTKDGSMQLDFSPAKHAARIQAVVDLVALTTVMDRQGHARYEARIALQNRSEQFLKVKVPKGLKLWSAKVADQPVKPVTAKDTGPDEILIPLVKTSPGGLPYDVVLYFAGQIIQPLEGITKLDLPAIEIIGIPVMQTTWSVQLPGGYRYMRPGGNMAPIAGTAEMLSISLGAKLEQMKRLTKTYRETAVSDSRQKYAKGNIDVFNKKLETDIRQAETLLEANRDDIGEEEYQRIKSKLGGQKQLQTTSVDSYANFLQQQQDLKRQDMNAYLNDSVSNLGVTEITRNSALWENPQFVQRNWKRQIERLEQELNRVKQQQNQFRAQDSAELQTLSPVDQTRIQGLIAEDADQAKEISGIIDEITVGNAARITQQQIQQTAEQLKDLETGGRAGRFYQSQVDKAQVVTGPGGMQRGYEVTKKEVAQMPKAPGITYSFKLEPGIVANRANAVDAGFMGSISPITPDGKVSIAGGAAIAGEGIKLYEAAGVYSLPVTLPEGEVRLDFARPSGQAQLTLWAVPVKTVYNIYGTITVLVALVVIIAIIKLWPKGLYHKPPTKKRIFVYILVVLGVMMLLGFVGFLISILIVLLSEAARNVSRRQSLPANS